MTKNHQTREKLLAELRKTPIVQVACRRADVSTSTYYRWREEDESFAEAADKALLEGTRLVNDMAESQLLTAIRDQNMTAIIFWLKHHHNNYSTRVEITAKHKLDDQLTPEQQAIVTEALRLSGMASQADTTGKAGGRS